MDFDDHELKFIYEYLNKNPWSSARQIGKLTEGGKSRVNHFLYKYKDVLFVKKGFTPPEWQIIDTNKPVKQQRVKSRKPAKQARNRNTVDPQIALDRLKRYNGLPTVEVCPSCDRPIQMSGSCGCT
jgi:hypothetical protein